MTRSTDWLVSAKNVRQLLSGKLLPLGIGAPAEGDAVRDVRAGGGSASPLRINARTRLLGPGVIDQITKVLQVLFSPFVMAPVLLVAAFAHAWLYFAHGVGGAMQEVLYAPGLSLVVLGILFVSGIFH